MTIPTTIPITITEEASARVAHLGMQRELEQMLEHTVRTVPDLRSIEVVLAPPYDTGDDPRVIIEATRAGAFVPSDRTDRLWGVWKISTFPPEVCTQFLMMTIPGGPS